MLKKFHFALLGISSLSMLAVLPAMAEEIDGRQVLNAPEGSVLDGVGATGIENGDTGGVLLSNYKLQIKNGTFTNNHSGAAAVLYDNSLDAYKNGGTYSVTIEDSYFARNSAGDFGAVAIFSPNSLVSGSTFSGNSATANYANLGDGGGALFLGSESQTIVFNNVFTGNSSGTIGGAIATRPINYWLDTTYSGQGTNSSVGAKVDILNSLFENNTAGTRGGAFFNSFYNSDAKEGYAYVKKSTFNNNTAGLGGAIFVEGWTDAVGGNAKLWIDNSSFVGNTANTDGGAIYNESVLVVADGVFTNNTATTDGGAIYNSGASTFAGTNVFSGNTAGGVANDIYNSGTVVFAADSVTTMDGGITGAGTVTIDEGATLNLGTASIVQNSIDLNGTLNVTLKDTDEFAWFNISDSFASSTGNGILNLDLRVAGEYTIFEGEIFDSDNITVSSSVFDYEWNEDLDTITVTMKSVEDIAAENGLTSESAGAIANLVESTSEKLNDFADLVQDELAAGNVGAVEEATKAIHPETESVAQSVTTSLQSTLANLAAGRMTMVQSPMGRRGGDAAARSGVWVEGLYNKSKQNDAFNGYTRGIVAGIDTIAARSLMLGVGYSYAHSDVSGTARNTEIDSNTIFLYGQYKPTAWYMNAMLNYTMSDYTEKADVLGVAVKSDYDVDALGVQVMTGYDFAGGITPEVGLRYMHISMDEYKNSLGVKNKLDNSDYLTAVLGTKYAFDYRVARGFTLRPELRYAVKYDLVSDKSVATVTMPGVPSYVLDGNRLSRIGAEFGGGLVMKYQDFSLSLNYDIEVREGYTSQTGRVRARLVF